MSKLQCGGGATAAWIQREMAKRVQSPYFLVTFTLPAQLRSCFFGPHAKEAYDLFFTAVSRALSEKLATAKGFKADVSGFTATLNYLGTYVARTAIYDARLVKITEETVSFRWKNREAGRVDVCTLPGTEFVRRYLQHVLPRGLRSIRYYGFCHPAAKAKRLRVQCHAGGPVQLGDTSITEPPARPHLCPCCAQPMTFLRKIPSPYSRRGPPPPVALFISRAKS